MRASSGQEFSGGQRLLWVYSEVWLPVIPDDTQHSPDCQLLRGLHLPLLHVCFSRKVNSSNNLTLGGCNYSLSWHHWGRPCTVKLLQVSLKQLPPHCPHQRATFAIIRMEKGNHNCIAGVDSRAAFTGSRSTAKMTIGINFSPIICETF